ncbi:MAG: 50S ribosomal protein L5 [Patescibacteria group bacterium]
MIPIKDKIIKARPTLKTKLGVTNDLAAPRLVKVVVSSGTGKLREAKRQELVADRLTKITGQRAAPRGSKKSVASFKVRQGEVIGHMVTLRGARMYDFLDRLLNIAIPRTRDFRGYDDKSVDEVGNLTIGVREHSVFPETADEDLKDVFGLAVTIVTTAKSRAEALDFFHSIGFPFKKGK